MDVSQSPYHHVYEVREANETRRREATKRICPSAKERCGTARACSTTGRIRRENRCGEPGRAGRPTRRGESKRHLPERKRSGRGCILGRTGGVLHKYGSKDLWCPVLTADNTCQTDSKVHGTRRSNFA